VLTACWSAKGGVGTTVVATCLALLIGARDPAGAVIADLCGDVPDMLGVAAPRSPGIAGWLCAGDGVPADALTRMQVSVADGLVLLPRGDGSLGGERTDVLARLLEDGPRPVVADCGLNLSAASDALVSAATRSLLVTRPCYLALRHASRATRRPTGVVVVREPGRVLGAAHVEEAVGAPIVAEVETDVAVSRAVDAGLLASRLPLAIERGLRRAL
jgi:MinD-like ATPase involved in chromosome partitioning or flagellar assembly